MPPTVGVKQGDDVVARVLDDVVARVLIISPFINVVANSPRPPFNLVLHADCLQV